MSNPSTPTCSPDNANDATFRHCLACDYNLTGLGDGPRCPECGLVHVPQAFREEVWKLVDSGKWFFSRMFHPFEKRPPGWWWALDRRGDVKRSFRFALQQFAATAILLAMIGLFTGSLIVAHRQDSALFDPTFVLGDSRELIAQLVKDDVDVRRDLGTLTATPDPSLGLPFSYAAADGYPARLSPEVESFLVTKTRDGLTPIGGWIREWSESLLRNGYGSCSADLRTNRADVNATKSVDSHSWYVRVRPIQQLPALYFMGGMSVLCSWLCPALVGMWTQIRHGLPAFAKAPRTIIAAANYESHRLPMAALVTLGMGALWFAAAASPQLAYHAGGEKLLPATLIGVLMFTAAGWIGPLRSDYTGQLIRSGLHATRIIVMYAIALPLLLGAGIWAVVFLLTWES